MSKKNKKILIYTDGGIRKKQMALGYVAYDNNGNIIFKNNKKCGKGSKATSNVAEYRAVIAALTDAIEKKFKNIVLYSDSQLIVKQINGEYRVRNPELYRHYVKVLQLLPKFDKYEIVWIKRNKNKYADSLVGKVFRRSNGKTK